MVDRGLMISAIYEKGTFRPTKPISMREASQVQLQILADNAEVDRFSFNHSLLELYALLDSVEKGWTNQTVRQLFSQMLEHDLRVLWHQSQPFQRELCSMLTLAATHVKPDTLTSIQVSAIRGCLHFLEQDELSEQDLDQCHEELTKASLHTSFAFDDDLIQSYVNDI